MELRRIGTPIMHIDPQKSKVGVGILKFEFFSDIIFYIYIFNSISVMITTKLLHFSEKQAKK